MIAFSDKDLDKMMDFINKKVAELHNEDAPMITDADHFYAEGYCNACEDIIEFISACTKEYTDRKR